MSESVGLRDAITPLDEVWDRDLRNAVFHADYSLHKGELRLPAVGRVLSHEEVETVVNRALAYHAALKELHRLETQRFTETRVISVHPRFAPDKEARILVRDDWGVIGVCDAELPPGSPHFIFGRFTDEERQLLSAEPGRGVFPPLPEPA
jgi:hypothetical protein